MSAAATHLCPCGCEAQVPNALFACTAGRHRLPLDYRRAIYATAALPLTDDRRLDAVTEAMDWYLTAAEGEFWQAHYAAAADAEDTAAEEQHRAR